MGERSTYLRHVMSQDGTLNTFKMHERCDHLASLWIDAFDHDGEGVAGGAYHHVVEDLCDRYGCTTEGLDAFSGFEAACNEATRQSKQMKD